MAKLDPKAVQEADAAFYKEHPEMIGTKIHPTDPDHQEYRDEWWNQYKEALECNDGTSGKKPKETGFHCPNTKKIQIKIISLTFKSDHLDDKGKKLLKKSVGDYKDSNGNEQFEFKKPEWDISRGGSADSHPISHTKGGKVKIDIKLDVMVTPEGESVTLTELKGVSYNTYKMVDSFNKSKMVTLCDFLTFRKDMNLKIKTGPVQIKEIEAKKSLPECVAALEDCTIEWSVTIDGNEEEIGTTGPHIIYVTLDRPNGKISSPSNNIFVEEGLVQDITEERLKY